MKKKSFILSRIINILVSAVQIIMGLYIVLKLFGAAEVPFVHWIYTLSAPLLAPFKGIFHSILFQESYYLDLSAVFALIVYSIAGYVLVRLALVIESRG
ncbi:hypothetical protein GCM10011391_29400 [Pullulanibacillus camelliae]|uniref:YggT family protein n=2 Tax=Pullulanibacillus camelliae TaxID=1707096 RepID=A0A8J3DZQ4_9BACL|nr:hypothetical protein GCM10011391_29400 [Pullulanibacillus camelliae]